MDLRNLPVGGRESRSQLLIRPIVDVDQPEIVILTVAATTFGVIVVLEPMNADELWDGRKVPGCRGAPGRPFLLCSDRHQMAVVAISSAVLAGGEEPFGHERGLAAGQFSEPVEEIIGYPA